MKWFHITDFIRRKSTDVSRLIINAVNDNKITLDLSNMSLTNLPEDILKLKNLRKLILANNSIANFPLFLSDLDKLEYLDISHNKLTTLPPEIGFINKLRVLDLSDNQLISLPDTISELRQLIILNVSNNKLVKLPETIGNNKNLVGLDISYNNLEYLPEALMEIASLQVLYLNGNEQLLIPPDLLGDDSNQDRLTNRNSQRNPIEILEHYRRIRDNSRPFNELKLIVVGRGGVGKTSLINRLVYNKFNQSELITEGIQITKWEASLSNQEKIRLNIWDFGGQEILHATHQFFITERSLYLLVINGRDGMENADADYWLKLIDCFGNNSPLIVVLNKINETPFEVNRSLFHSKYPEIRHFVKTDCKDGTGIDDLCNAILRETEKLTPLHIPASWFSIKDRLTSMNKNFISYKNYCKICEEFGETAPEDQNALARYLHNLGVILYYNDDDRLKDTHIINPRWVTNGIYKILHSEKATTQNGEISLNDLSGILEEGDYPTYMCRFLFDLMMKFDLCFNSLENDLCYLIPDLLSLQEPPEVGEFIPTKCLNFQYHYDILPVGLLPRFIVRTKSLSEGLPRWRSGVILKFEGNLALVKADLQEKKISICVKGPQPGNRRLLSIIRSDFERLHRLMKNISPKEMVPLLGHSDVVIPYNELLIMENSDPEVVEFPKVVDGRIELFNVKELLNGLDIDYARLDESTKECIMVVRVFFSYSHKDENLRDELETHLKLLQRQGIISTWHDRKIGAGNEWKQEIDNNIESANIILILISSDFIASDYCYDNEMKRALERHEKGEATVIPIIVRDVSWSIAPFAKLQVLPRDGLAVTKWIDRDSAWRDVSEGIIKAVTAIRFRGDYKTVIRQP